MFNNMYLPTRQKFDKRQKLTQREHELLIYETTLELAKSYDISFNRRELIPSDLKMADRVYNAAIELLERVGVFFSDEEKALELNREDIWAAIQSKRRSFMIGEGADATQLRFRDVLDDRMPVIMGGPTAIPVSSEMYVPIHRSYAKVGTTDSIGPATIHRLPGDDLIKPLVSLYSAHEAISGLKQACKLEGRPGLCCISPPFVEDVRTALSIANPGIMGPGDFQEMYPLPDLTAKTDEIVKASHYKLIGSNYLCTHQLVMGGMTNGSAEQFAIQIVAEALKSNTLYSGIFFKVPTNVKMPTSTSADTLWASSLASIAISRNTHCISGTVVNNSAGPCTKMSFYETAVQTIGCTVCGDDIISGPVLNNGSMVDHAAGLESQFMAEIAELARTLSIEDSNFLCMQLYEKYRNKVKMPETGKSFSECYDLTTLAPSIEYRNKYSSVIKEIFELLSNGLR